MNCLVFDIETVPDVELGRRLYGLEGLDDAAVAKAMFAHQRAATGHEFLPHLQQRVVAIACALRTREQLVLWSLGDPDSGEAELLRRFFEGIEKYSPELISWNGGGFDLPVLHYRTLKAGVQAPRYWETGDEDGTFRYNNYLSRFHWRHLDLMDVLSGFQARSRASLADVAALLGFPGKLGFSGERVWQAYLDGQIVAVRRYCETDVLNTYLIYLRFQHMRGRMDAAGLAAELERVRRLLQDSGEPHHREFLQAWQAPQTGEAEMALEIERKFRVASDAWRGEVHSRRLLRQGYLANTARASVRVRLDGEQGWLSVKAMRGGMSRDEYEVAIALTDAGEMLERLCEGFVIEKWRHLVEHAGHTWEIDEFLAENAGLVIAELELPAEDAPFERPTWLGAEITEEARFYNVRLSQKPFRHWPENLLASR